MSGELDGMLESTSAHWLVPFLLLLMREHDSYGHELTRRVADLDSGVMRPEAVYRALGQMEGEGMVLSKAGGLEDCGLSQHRYSITESGEAYLEFWANSLEQYQENVDLFLRAYAERLAQGVRSVSNGNGRVPLEDSRLQRASVLSWSPVICPI